MSFGFGRLTQRFALLLGAAAVLPLVAFGVVSIVSLQRGTRESVVNGNLNVATRAAEEIRRYISTDAELLKALAADLQNTELAPWQRERILRNYVLQFREFRELTLFDEERRPLATSRIGPPRVQIPTDARSLIDGVSMSPIRIDDDLLPTTTFAIHLTRLNQPAGWLVGEFSLEAMWQMVDGIRIGGHGYALVVAPDGQLLADGDPNRKAWVAQSRNMAGHPLVSAGGGESHGPVSQEYVDDDGRRQLAVGARVAPIGWTVIVEQPTAEAYASASQLTRQLVFAIAGALLVVVLVGFVFGRRTLINPILRLREGTERLASGQLDAHVEIRTADEFGDLGKAFNTMAERLIELQENVKRQERQAMFGRIAAGLVHDLSHPVQNIGNSTRLLLREDTDADSRQTLRQTIERELATLKRFMEDLRNVVKPKPIERFPMDVNGAIAEIVESTRAEGERNGVAVETVFDDGPLTIEGDRFALGRVFRNLITNAIQATAAGGRVSISTRRDRQQVEITVTDTGSGIPADRLPRIFDDFVTTKRHGLGLGLAISKRIVEQLDGTIGVASEVGRGTSFTLRFPLSAEPSALQAASARDWGSRAGIAG